MGRDRSRNGPVVATASALAVVNVATNLLLPEPVYVPFALGAAAGLVAYAVRADGRSAGDLGGSRIHLPTGLRWGGILVAGVAAVYAAGAALPATRPLFEDARVEDLDGWAVVYRGLLRVPLATVALEEVAFRGVLLSMLLARTSAPRAVAASSVLFGLWHVLPALGIATVNPVQAEHLSGPGGTAVAVTGAVAGTTAAGAVLCWLRLRTGSLAAPMLLHWATNGLGYLTAWLVLRA